MLFTAWQDLARTAIVGTLAYLALVFLLRISGKRTLSKMNAFDLVVTVALGSTLAATMLNKSITLAEGATGFFVLVAVQYILTWLSVRSRFVRRLVKSEPTLLAFRGQMLERAMKEQRVTQDELASALRHSGAAGLEDIEAVVLETNADLTIVKKSGQGPAAQSVLNVRGYPDPTGAHPQSPRHDP
ncbi:MAG: DUF421 domain-containing protein [Sumerlaeia bacterium]